MSVERRAAATDPAARAAVSGLHALSLRRRCGRNPAEICVEMSRRFTRVSGLSVTAKSSETLRKDPRESGGVSDVTDGEAAGTHVPSLFGFISSGLWSLLRVLVVHEGQRVNVSPESSLLGCSRARARASCCSIVCSGARSDQ